MQIVTQIVTQIVMQIVMQTLTQLYLKSSGIGPKSSYIPDDDEDKLTGRLRPHVLGNITSFSSSTINGIPNVQPAVNGGGFNDDAIMKLGLADHLYDANLLANPKRHFVDHLLYLPDRVCCPLDANTFL